MQTSLVSILIPFKNSSLFLPECLDSIVNQIYKDWELVIVDDHSTDESFAIVNSYAKHEPRIKLLKNKGSGIIDALSLAFDHSNGQYITRMDSDDIMTTNKIEVMLHDLQTYGKNHLALGLVRYFNEEGINDGYYRYEVWLNELTKSGNNFSEIYKECVVPSPCWMIHRDDFLACDGFKPDRYPEDYDLTFRFYKHGIKCIPSKNLLHLWRDYDTRTSRTHVHYAQNYFLSLKIYYFLELDYNSTRPLIIWGAGKKGKRIAKLLIKRNIPFNWICNNSKKIGHIIYGVELYNYKFLKTFENPQTIVTVANETSQTRIKAFFEKQEMKTMLDYFFFC